MELTMNKKKKVDMRFMCEELLEEIFTHVPMKPLVRMKCVSQGWCHLISSHVQRRKNTNTSGLFVHYLTSRVDHRPSWRDVESQVTFHDLKPQGLEINCIERDSHSFALEHVWFSGSSNGLLLCHCHVSGGNYVCNPILNEWVLLPPVDNLHLDLITGVMGLAYDGIPDHHYKVVYFSSPKFMIFSSRTGKWRKHHAKLLNWPQQRMPFVYEQAPFLFLKGVIHWIRMGYILGYHVEKNVFKIEELPKNGLKQQNTLSARRDGSGEYDLGECLWDAEGSLHYCHTYQQLINIWTYGEKGCDHTGTSGKWQLKYKLEFNNRLDPWNPKIVNRIDRRPTITRFGRYYATLVPCGFNEKLQAFYFRSGGHVYAYSFETQVTKNVCTYEYKYGLDSISSRFQVFPFVFNSLRLPLGGESKLVMLKKESSQITGRPLLLFS